LRAAICAHPSHDLPSLVRRAGGLSVTQIDASLAVHCGTENCHAIARRSSNKQPGENRKRMRIGLIQSRGLGDIIIALPIAKYLFDRGNEVLWPIHEDFVPSFRAAARYVEFIPIKTDRLYSMYEVPLERLQSRGCERIVPLYSRLTDHDEIINKRFAASFRFDEYKYAVAGVPFREKWNLSLVRNREREERLFQDVFPGRDFVVCHLEGSSVKANLDVEAIAGGRAIVEITSRTDNILDWISVIERASLRIMIDSCFSNLTEQLQIAGPKVFIRRSEMAFTPVMLGDWTFAA
jgi:hypothetical protein